MNSAFRFEVAHRKELLDQASTTSASDNNADWLTINVQEALLEADRFRAAGAVSMMPPVRRSDQRRAHSHDAPDL